MPSDDLDQSLRDALHEPAPADVHRRAQTSFHDFARSLSTKRQSDRPLRRSRWFWWTGLSLAGASAVVLLLLTLLAGTPLTWAQVVERFRALHFFNATIYFTDNASEPPEKIELWAAQDHRSRVHYRGLIFFGEGEKLTRIIDSRHGQDVDLDELKSRRHAEAVRTNYPALNLVLSIQEGLARMPEFSLDAMLKFFQSDRTQLAPVPNLSASTAEDMQVFDVTNRTTPEWLRIWVLKKSGLPVRLRSHDPRDGEQVEVMFDYLTEMPAEAFDPDRVQRAIQRTQGHANKLYALLQDPGGQLLTPGDMFRETGYHLPGIKSCGRTSDGVVWVWSTNAMNRRADGHAIWGFNRLTDDAGQAYLHRNIGTSPMNGNETLDYFVPLNFGYDVKTPDNFVLTCTDAEEWFEHRAVQTVGSLEITQWEADAAMPELWKGRPAPDTHDFLRELMSEASQRQDWPLLKQVIALVPGDPEDGNLALTRDMYRCRMLDAIRETEAASRLRARLFEIIRQNPKPNLWQSSEVVDKHIADLWKAGETNQARRLANEHANASLARDDNSKPYLLCDLIQALNRVGMKEAELRAFFDQDLLALPDVRQRLTEFGFFRQTENNPWTGSRFAEWRAYLTNLARRYDSQPLPERLEFVETTPSLSPGQHAAALELPNHPGYRVWFLNPNAPGFLTYNIAARFKVRPAMTLVASEAAARCRPTVVVCSTNLPWADLWSAYLDRCGVVASEITKPKTVLVARYDGRPLPGYQDVQPLDASDTDGKLVIRAGGTSSTAQSVLMAFERALNADRAPDDPQSVVIIDETGLPRQPGPNQSQANVCLTYEYAFWSGAQAKQMAFDWFRKNFGITFHEEQREMKVVALNTKSSAR